MAEKQLLELRAALRKDMEDDKKVVDILRQLELVPVTLQLLKSTKIGKTLGKIVRDGSDEVKKVANPLLNKWKSVAKGAGNSVKKELHKKESSANSVPKDIPSNNETMETPSNNSAKENTSTEYPLRTVPSVTFPSEKTRNVICVRFAELFDNDEGVTDAEKNLVAFNIEAALYEISEFSTANKEYKGKYRTLMFNLPKNAKLRENLITGTVTANMLVNMQPAELADAKKQEERSRAMKEHFNASRNDWLDANRDNLNKQAGVKHTGGLFKCSRCKSTKTTHYQKQTRSADEPMTVFVQCTNCPNRWRC